MDLYEQPGQILKLKRIFNRKHKTPEIKRLTPAQIAHTQVENGFLELELACVRLHRGKVMPSAFVSEVVHRLRRRQANRARL